MENMAVETSKIKNLDELQERLRLKIPSAKIFQHLNARLMIQLGVNLKDILPEQNNDAALLQRVVDALGRMNIRMEIET
jgi:hypothetical protein